MCLPLWTYEPLTDEEIIDYWYSLTLDQKIQEIKKLDLLEHIPPSFEMFRYLAVLTKDNELIIYPEKKQIEMTHVHLIYEIELPSFYMKDFIIPVKKKYVLAGLSGAGIAILGTVITGEDIWWKYALSGTIGLCTGIIVEYCFR
jgi:hypothetical protein